MNIGFVHPFLYNKRGTEKQLFHLASNLQKMGDYVEIYTRIFDKEKTHAELTNDLIIRETGPKTVLGKLDYKLSFLTSLPLCGAVDKKMDVVVIHNAPIYFASYIGKPAVWICNDPQIWHWVPLYKRILLYLPNIFLDKISVNKLSDIIVLDQRNKNLIWKLFKRDSRIIQCGVDMSLPKKSNPDAIRKKHNIRNYEKVLLYVSDLHESKRIQDVLLALKLLNRKDIRFIIVGDGPYKQKLVDISSTLDAKVDFVSGLSEVELFSYYAMCDISLFVAESQTWGITPFEAMACKKPVIVSSDCGAAEVLIDNENAIIVPPRYPEIIAKKIQLLLSDEQLAKKMGIMGHKFVEENLSWERYAINVRKVLENVIENGK